MASDRTYFFPIAALWATFGMFALGCGGPDGQRDEPVMVVLVAPDAEWTGPLEVRIEGREGSFWVGSRMEEGDEGGDEGEARYEVEHPCGPDAIAVERGTLSLHAEGERGFHWRLEEELDEAGCHSLELSLHNTLSAFYVIFAVSEGLVPLQVWVGSEPLAEIQQVFTEEDERILAEAMWAAGPDGEMRWNRGGQMKLALGFEAEGKAAVFIGPAGEYEFRRLYPGGFESRRIERLAEGEFGFSKVYDLS